MLLESRGSGDVSSLLASVRAAINRPPIHGWCEHLLTIWRHADNLPLFQSTLLRFLTRELSPELLTIVKDQFDPRFEAQLADARNAGFPRRKGWLLLDRDRMRADEAAAEPRDRPDEPHDELTCRVLIDLLRLTHLLHPPLVQHDKLVGNLHRLFLVVRDQYGGYPDLLPKLAQPAPKLLPHVGIQRPEGLIEQEHLWLNRQRAGQYHALTLPARELCWIAVREAFQLHQAEQLGHSLPDLWFGSLANL